MTIKSNSFAEACYNMSTIEELENALSEGPDAFDMANWNLTDEEWEHQIKAAIKELKEDECE